MQINQLHPLTYLIVTFEAAILAVHLPPSWGLLFLALLLILTLCIPSRTSGRLTRPFLRILAVAAFFIFTIHCVRFFPPGLNVSNCSEALINYIHISVPVVSVLFLSRRITSDELFALLIDCRVPSAVILILYRTLWLIPRLIERTDEVVVALKLRCVPLDTPIQRMKAVAPAFSTIFASMFTEITDNALVITARGFLLPGRKTHMLKLSFSFADVLVISLVTTLLAVVWF